MKRFNILVILSLFSLVLNLTACVNYIPAMTEEEEKVIVRYMADAVVKNDSSYESTLLDPDEKSAALLDEELKAEELKKIVEEENKAKVEKNEINTPDSLKTEVVQKVFTDADLNDYIDLKDVEFEYAGYEILDKYPNTNDFGVLVYKPENGKILVVKMNVCNNSSGPQTIDLTKTDLKIKVIINNDIVVPKINQNLFLESFDNFMEDFAIEEVKESVLLFEIEDDIDINSLDLNVKSKEGQPIKIHLE